MTPEEKALYIYNRYKNDDRLSLTDKQSKQISLITIYNIILSYELDSVVIKDERINENINFYNKVISEIEKL